MSADLGDVGMWIWGDVLTFVMFTWYDQLGMTSWGLLTAEGFACASTSGIGTKRLTPEILRFFASFFFVVIDGSD